MGTRLITLSLLFISLLASSLTPYVSADECNPNDTKSAITCGTTKTSGGAPISGDPQKSINDTIKQVINILSALIGVIATIMVVFGGFKYITSGGDSNKVASAKSTILYAVVGIIIVVLAQTLIRFTTSNTVKNLGTLHIIGSNAETDTTSVLTGQQ